MNRKQQKEQSYGGSKTKTKNTQENRKEIHIDKKGKIK